MEHSPLKEGKGRNPSLVYLSPVHLLIPKSVWSAQPGQLPKATNPPVPKVRWAHSVFHLYSHLAIIYVPSIGLEDVTAHIEILAKSTQQALNDSKACLTKH